jgi:hypothetical protein
MKQNTKIKRPSSGSLKRLVGPVMGSTGSLRNRIVEGIKNWRRYLLGLALYRLDRIFRCPLYPRVPGTLLLLLDAPVYESAWYSDRSSGATWRETQAWRFLKQFRKWGWMKPPQVLLGKLGGTDSSPALVVRLGHDELPHEFDPVLDGPYFSSDARPNL